MSYLVTINVYILQITQNQHKDMTKCLMTEFFVQLHQNHGAGYVLEKERLSHRLKDGPQREKRSDLTEQWSKTKEKSHGFTQTELSSSDRKRFHQFYQLQQTCCRNTTHEVMDMELGDISYGRKRTGIRQDVSR